MRSDLDTSLIHTPNNHRFPASPITTSPVGPKPNIIVSADAVISLVFKLPSSSVPGRDERNLWYTLQDSNLRPSDPKSDALFN